VRKDRKQSRKEESQTAPGRRMQARGGRKQKKGKRLKRALGRSELQILTNALAGAIVGARVVGPAKMI